MLLRGHLLPNTSVVLFQAQAGSHPLFVKIVECEPSSQVRLICANQYLLRVRDLPEVQLSVELLLLDGDRLTVVIALLTLTEHRLLASTQVADHVREWLRITVNEDAAFVDCKLVPTREHGSEYRSLILVAHQCGPAAGDMLATNVQLDDFPFNPVK